jgi:hypothetical protein
VVALDTIAGDTRKAEGTLIHNSQLGESILGVLDGAFPNTLSDAHVKKSLPQYEDVPEGD